MRRTHTQKKENTTNLFLERFILLSSDEFGWQVCSSSQLVSPFCCVILQHVLISSPFRNSQDNHSVIEQGLSYLVDGILCLSSPLRVGSSSCSSCRLLAARRRRAWNRFSFCTLHHARYVVVLCTSCQVMADKPLMQLRLAWYVETRLSVYDRLIDEPTSWQTTPC